MKYFDIEGKIDLDLDALFEQACGFLEVKLHKFKAKVVVQEENKDGGFYVPDRETIYVDKGANKYVLIHEITHAILNQYFLMPVSERIAEVLCGFVEYEARKINGD
jgi:hypothetical protein